MQLVILKSKIHGNLAHNQMREMKYNMVNLAGCIEYDTLCLGRYDKYVFNYLVKPSIAELKLIN